MIHRRRLIATAAAGLLVAPQAGRAQSGQKVYRIGTLGNFVTADATGPQPRSPYTNAFMQGMRELAYAHGRHFVTEPRGSGGDGERFPMLVAELVGLQLDVIVAAGQPLPALKPATSTIPVVMTAANDPVAAGYVRSLSRPGGNMTGMSLQSTETTAKRLDLLKQFVPGAAPVAVLWDRDRRVSVPSAFVLREDALAGGLMSYGPNLFATFRYSAKYADKVLRGARPGDLPVEQPTQFDLVINLKTARALGLAFPQSLVLRADEVIE
jgi:ABC-type uncharacterized transport system substrate-binding protein